MLQGEYRVAQWGFCTRMLRAGLAKAFHTYSPRQAGGKPGLPWAIDSHLCRRWQHPGEDAGGVVPTAVTTGLTQWAVSTAGSREAHEEPRGSPQEAGVVQPAKDQEPGWLSLECWGTEVWGCSIMGPVAHCVVDMTG